MEDCHATEREEPLPLYRTLSTLTGDPEAVAEMMSYFPAREVEEPATKEFVRAELADHRAEMTRQLNRFVIWIGGVNAAQLAVVVALFRKG